jgi:hypothetical protein
MLPVLEDLAAEGERVKVNHYWLFVINIRDRRFEVLDSLRALIDAKFRGSVNRILAAIKTLWEQYYATSKINFQNFDPPQDIKPPRQLTK